MTASPGGANIDTIYGGDGNDSIGDSPVSDVIFWGGDTLYGGDGNDFLYEGSTMAGGPGNDVYVTEPFRGGISEAPGEGTDEVQLGTPGASSYTPYTLPANVENLRVTDDFDWGGNLADVNVMGNELANGIIGNAADNVFSGLAGNDTLVGLDGNDTLDGGAGVDRLAGMAAMMSISSTTWETWRARAPTKAPTKCVQASPTGCKKTSRT
jgi:Ca2+-binding RTX toxin-like protein